MDKNNFVGYTMVMAGRPELPDDERRARKLPVRFSDRDLDSVRENAEKAGRSLTDWVRERLGLKDKGRA